MAVYAVRKYRKQASNGTVKEVIRYKATVTIKGFPRKSRTFDRKTDAQAWAEKLEYEYKHQSAFGEALHKTKTVKDALDRYTSTLKLSQPKRHRDIVYILHSWETKIGHIKIGDVTKDMLIKQRDSMLGLRVKGNPDKGQLSNASVNRMMSVINRLFNVMVDEWGWLSRNPMQGIKSLPESKGRTRFLQGDELERLLAAARKSDNSDLYAIIVLAITSGARRGEIENIRPKDVDFVSGRILLPITKNGRPRTLYIVGQSYDAIKVVYARMRRDQKYLFASPHDAARPNDFRSSWHVAVKRAALEDFKFHDLRHSAASFYAQSGAGLHQIAEILGHSSFHVTKRYTHLLETDTVDVVNKTAERVFKDAGDELEETREL